MKPVKKIEICCGGLEDAINAETAGASRIELNSALFLGGLTPSIGALAEAKKRLNIPVMVMIRPRAAGFCYSAEEYATMEADARFALENGADGIVFGFLTENGDLDEERSARFREIAGKSQAVFHRAIDVSRDPKATLLGLMKLGIDRVLTSGAAPTVPEGIGLINDFVELSGGKIDILPGGGITRGNIDLVAANVNTPWLHFAALKYREEPSCRHNPSIYFGGGLFPREDLVEIGDKDVMSKMIRE